MRCMTPPDSVRSNTAPHCSRLAISAGDSFACSSAMRQLFRYLPPNIVSLKCALQLSRGSTLPSAAAMPPSATIVCALPRSDLQMIVTRAPCAAASIAARSPAPPAPMTITSASSVCTSVPYILDEPEVLDDAHRAESDVQVGEADAKQ